MTNVDAQNVSLAPILLPEIAISTAINGLIPPAIIWALNVPAPTGITDGVPLIPALAPATILPIFLMTLVLTLVVRARVTKGSMPRLHAVTAFRGSRFVALRAALFAALGVIVLIPCAVLAAHTLDLLPLSRNSFGVFNVVYGAFIGVFVTPFVVLAAMSDGPRPQS